MFLVSLFGINKWESVDLFEFINRTLRPLIKSRYIKWNANWIRIEVIKICPAVGVCFLPLLTWSWEQEHQYFPLVCFTVQIVPWYRQHYCTGGAESRQWVGRNCVCNFEVQDYHLFRFRENHLAWLLAWCAMSLLMQPAFGHADRTSQWQYDHGRTAKWSRNRNRASPYEARRLYENAAGCAGT